jgi:predicted HicB family RNase H-like nuclease
MKKPQGRPPQLIQVGWRISKSMRDALKREAKRRGTSMNTEVRMRLKKSLRRGIR